MLFDKLFAKSQNTDIESATYLLTGAGNDIEMGRIAEDEDFRHTLIWYAFEDMIKACYLTRDLNNLTVTLSLMRNLGLVVRDNGAFKETCDIAKEVIGDIAEKAGIEL